MTKLLSDLNNSIEFVPKQLSPFLAGMTINAATDDVSTYTAKNWLECDGSAISRTTYAELFANIGTKFGVGDGSTTFNLPNGPRSTFDIDLDVSGTNNWVTTRAIGNAYQSANGVWKVKALIRGATDSTGTLTLTLAGVTFPSVNQAVTVAVNTTANPADALTNPSTNTIKVECATARTAWFIEFDVEVTGKPTDAFVAASTFSTFDEALESIPMIKAYNDSSNISMSLADATATKTGAVRLSSDFAAGDGVYGFVQANKFQTKIVGSDVTTDTTFMTFNNLTIGKAYKVHLGLSVAVNSTDTFISIKVAHDGSFIGVRPANITGTGVSAVGISGTIPFVATASTLEIQTQSSSANAFVYADTPAFNGRTSRVTLEECDNLIETTDFT